MYLGFRKEVRNLIYAIYGRAWLWAQRCSHASVPKSGSARRERRQRGRGYRRLSFILVQAPSPSLEVLLAASLNRKGVAGPFSHC